MVKLVSERDGFRTYEPETLRDREGRLVTMVLCEEWVEGRWEPFYSIRTAR